MNLKSLPSFPESILIFLLIGLTFVLVAISESVVPVHYNISGKADGFGSRYILLVIPVLGLALYAFIKWMKRFTGYFNYPVKITDENKAGQEALALKLLDTCGVITLVVFNLMITHLIYNSLTDTTSGIWIWGLVFFVSYLLPIPIYLKKAYRLK